MSPVAVALPVVEYPSSDGKPMAETPVHRDVMIDAIQILKRRFASRSDAYASGDVLMYYEEGIRGAGRVRGAGGGQGRGSRHVPAVA